MITESAPLETRNPIAQGSLDFDRADLIAVGSILAVAVLVYGVWISRLGFYWDDWPVIWVYKALGRSGVIRYFAAERPVAGVMYAFLFPFLGTSPLGWQLVAFLVRLASTVLLYLALRILWPTHREIAWLTGVMVLLYPGFSEQAIALNFLEQSSSFLFFSISLAATLLALTRRSHRWVFILIALSAELIAYLITEFYVALELFRLAVIVIVVRREFANGKPLARKTLTLWSPYAAIWAIYIVWRSFFLQLAAQFDYTDVRSQMAVFRAHPLHQLIARAEITFQNVVMSTAVAWARPFRQELSNFDRLSVLAWTVGLLAAGICLIALRTIGRPRTRELSFGKAAANKNPLHEGIVLSIVGLCVAGLPYAMSSLRVEYSSGGPPYFSDRFALSFMLPASLALACLVEFCAVRQSRRAVAAVIILVFSVFQFRNDAAFYQDWLRQKSLFWQIAWRAPELKRDTGILLNGLPRSLCRNHAAGMLNMLYGADDGSGRLSYFIFDMAQLAAEGLPASDGGLSYEPGAPMIGRLRTYTFQGSTSQSLVSWIAPDGTWRIVAKPYVNENLDGSALSLNVGSLSSPAAVIADSPMSPRGDLFQIYGGESTSQWLYYYQKAELARQLAQWNHVATLGDAARLKGYAPDDMSEWFPFIEGYAMTGRYQDATTLSRALLKNRPDAIVPLSSLWSRVKAAQIGARSTDLGAALQSLSSDLILEKAN